MGQTDTEECGFHSATNSTTTFPDPTDPMNTIVLNSPSLDIEPFYSEFWRGNSSRVAYALKNGSNRTWDEDYISNHGICSPDKTYQWGFSGLLLFFSIILTTVWALGMWAMWLDAYLQSPLEHCGRSMGNYRAALDLAEVLQTELGERTRTARLSDDSLRRRMKDGCSVATITYDSIASEKDAGVRMNELGNWLERRRWGRLIWRHQFSSLMTLLFVLIVAIMLMVVVIWEVVNT